MRRRKPQSSQLFGRKPQLIHLGIPIVKEEACKRVNPITANLTTYYKTQRQDILSTFVQMSEANNNKGKSETLYPKGPESEMIIAKLLVINGSDKLQD